MTPPPRENGWPAARPSRSGWVGLLLLLHALVLAGWQFSMRPGPATASGREAAPRLTWLLAAGRPAPPDPGGHPAAPPAPRAAPAQAPRAPRGAAPQPPPDPRPRAALAEAPLPAPVVPTAAAEPPSRVDTASTLTLHPASAAPAGADSLPGGAELMDGEATRRALRDIARQPLHSERAAQATDQPLRSGAQRRAEAASAAGKGDCGKGEFAGSGAGLLSLPFLAAAVARGQCAR